jgi:hypothetical protein
MDAKRNVAAVIRWNKRFLHMCSRQHERGQGAYRR